MIYITGDTHMSKDINKLSLFKDKFKPDDFIIILGDYGLPGFSREIDRFLMGYYARLGCTVLFIDGNHEHFDKLNNYAVSEWNGGKVQFITKNVIHLMRGEIYTIDGVKMLTCGGGLSIDKHLRTEYIDWFKDEELTTKEFYYMMDNLEKHNNKVDIILTHTPPQHIVNDTIINMRIAMGIERDKISVIQDNTAIALNELENTVEYKKWLSGHLHLDMTCPDNKHILLYNTIIKLSDIL